MRYWLFLIISLISQGVNAQQTKIDPGPIEEMDEVMSVFGLDTSFLAEHPKFWRSHMKDLWGFSLVREDENFQYYKSGTSLFRLYKKPQPKLSHANPIPIQTIPALKWAGVFEFVGDQTAPAKPNCSEAAFGIEDYQRILSSPVVRTKQDFLNHLPKDALQKFTFITKSESLQRHGVTEMRPRVMRFRTDGKFVLTYTTSADSKAPDTIEAIFFDDKTRKFNFVHTEFLSEDQIRDGVYSRTTLNPRSCQACHGGIDPRPNWNPYEIWPGTYGEVDDLIDFSRAVNGQFQAYTRMRAELKGTPELESLPWPDPKSKYWEEYPYITIQKQQNYNYRPNAHFTIAASRLNAQRLARKMTEFSEFEKVRWSLLAHSIGCDGYAKDSSPNPILDALLKANQEPIRSQERKFYVYNSSKKSSDFLYRFGIAIGFSSTDWSLKFNKNPKPEFESFSTAQWEMRDQVESVLFRDATALEPRLAAFDVRYELMSNMFGAQFTCVDEVADRLWLTKKTKTPICQILKERSRAEIATIKAHDVLRAKEWKSTVWDDANTLRVDEISVEAGKNLMIRTCGQCHRNDQSIPFNFSDPKAIERLMKSEAGPGHRRIIESAVQECRMPMPIAGPCLSENEQSSLRLYLDGLVGGQ